MDLGSFRGFNVTMPHPGIALVTFDQPERMNGLLHTTKRELVETLAQAQLDDAVRVVVFTGTGKAFCAGDDISGQRPPESDKAKDRLPRIKRGKQDDAIRTYDALRTWSQPVNLAVRNLDKLSIAAINGFAIQSGLSLALACDFRIASKEAR
ncbi:MAG: enoyl-CoA hydratase/isomerase family protein, partial [Chloroflexi bacterium]|nr:enoyl-CoA hydratase/isomerase family protein [Chloroflexota bacterium]